MNETTWHFSEIVSLLKLRSEGEAICGEHGTITGYVGLVTCSDCQRAIPEHSVLHTEKGRSTDIDIR